MGKTSSAVKRRYNLKAYDRVAIDAPKGWKDKVKAAAADVNESLNAYVQKAVNDRMERQGIQTE